MPCTHAGKLMQSAHAGELIGKALTQNPRLAYAKRSRRLADKESAHAGELMHCAHAGELMHSAHAVWTSLRRMRRTVTGTIWDLDSDKMGLVSDRIYQDSDNIGLDSDKLELE